jgi:hypothetical protein
VFISFVVGNLRFQMQERVLEGFAEQPGGAADPGNLWEIEQSLVNFFQAIATR